MFTRIRVEKVLGRLWDGEGDAIKMLQSCEGDSVDQQLHGGGVAGELINGQNPPQHHLPLGTTKRWHHQPRTITQQQIILQKQSLQINIFLKIISRKDFWLF